MCCQLWSAITARKPAICNESGISGETTPDERFLPHGEEEI